MSNDGLVRVWRTDRNKWERVDPAKAQTLFELELATKEKPKAESFWNYEVNENGEADTR